MTDDRSVTWPLTVTFVLALLGSAAWIGRLMFGNWSPAVGFLLIGTLLVSGLLLYLPRMRSVVRPLDLATVVTKIDRIEAGLPDPARIAAIETAIADLQTRLDDVASKLDTTGPVRTEIGVVKDILTVGAVKAGFDNLTARLNPSGEVRDRLDKINAQLAIGGETRSKIEIIAAQFEAGGAVRKSLDAIEAKVKTA